MQLLRPTNHALRISRPTGTAQVPLSVQDTTMSLPQVKRLFHVLAVRYTFARSQDPRLRLQTLQHVKCPSSPEVFVLENTDERNRAVKTHICALWPTQLTSGGCSPFCLLYRTVGCWQGPHVAPLDQQPRSSCLLVYSWTAVGSKIGILFALNAVNSVRPNAFKQGKSPARVKRIIRTQQARILTMHCVNLASTYDVFSVEPLGQVVNWDLAP